MASETFGSPEQLIDHDFRKRLANQSNWIERADALKVGDFLDLSPREFNSWGGKIIEGDPKNLETKNNIRITSDGESPNFSSEARYTGESKGSGWG